MELRHLRRRLARLLGGREPPVWYDPLYRLPITSLEPTRGLTARRADFVVSYLVDHHIIDPQQLRRAQPISYAALSRVHTHDWLESLDDSATLAAVFAVAPDEIRGVEVMRTIRIACGATLAAARDSLEQHEHSINLLGGFHHAGPERGAGLCPVNDIAVAIAALRAEGFADRIAIIDVDAHPPDGTEACLPDDGRCWLGSISAANWGVLDAADETVIATATGDVAYLEALRALLGRQPTVGLAFVVAGGDVLAGDRLGGLGMSLDGARQRDLCIAEALDAVPTVWLPGGGYHADAWKLLAGTVMAVAQRSREPVADYDPLRARFTRIATSLTPTDLGAPTELSFDDVLADLGAPTATQRLMGMYTAEGLEHALSRYGILSHLRRLGLSALRIEIDRHNERDRLRVLTGSMDEPLIESLVERAQIEGQAILFVEWLLLQNPTLPFEPARPMLPGQQHPGLGLAHEAGELLIQMARRLGLHGVAFRPAWYHTAYAARHHCRFADPARQGRFLALLRDLGPLPLLDTTTAVDDGRVLLNGESYRWEAGVMVHWIDGQSGGEEAIARCRRHAHFTLSAPPAS